MEETENFEKDDELNRGDGHPSPSDSNSQSEMLRPWMRSLSKQYWQNQYLAKFDTLSDAIDALIRRPEPKETPDSYGESEDVEKAYRAAGLTKKEADAISAAYKQMIPERKDLKEFFGDRYDTVMSDYGKGVSGFADDLKDSIQKAGLDKDPVFVDVMSRVGKETGEDRFDMGRNNHSDKSDPAIRMVEAAYGK